MKMARGREPIGLGRGDLVAGMELDSSRERRWEWGALLKKTTGVQFSWRVTAVGAIQKEIPDL